MTGAELRLYTRILTEITKLRKHYLSSMLIPLRLLDP